MKKLYIISGCNGAGKTTASYTILPEILSCTEFVNADEIAKGLSPFQPEKEAIQAGRLMIERINQLLNNGVDFAFETTLATKSYKNFISRARENGYHVTLLFFWLQTSELAKKRVDRRVKEGGHHIPAEIIERRYEKGLLNFFNIFMTSVNEWILIDNSGNPYEIIADGSTSGVNIQNREMWNILYHKYKLM